MNSFNFLIAFVAVCTIPACYGGWSLPMHGDSHDGHDSHGTLTPGTILKAGESFLSGKVISSAPIMAAGHGGHGHHNDLMGHGDDCETSGAIVENLGHDQGHGWSSGHGSTWSSGLGSSSSWSSGHGSSSWLSGHDHGHGSSWSSGLDDGHLIQSDNHHEQPPNVLVHQQKEPIVINRPGNSAVVNNPGIVVKVNPVVIKRPPGVVIKPIIKHVQPKPVKVQPVFVRVVKPVEKIFVKKSYQDEPPVWSHTKVLSDCHH